MSFAAALLALVLTARLAASCASLGKHLGNPKAAPVTVVAGVAELVGNMLFIILTAETKVFVKAGKFANKDVGLTIAMVAGAAQIVSGPLVSKTRQTQASGQPGSAHSMAG